MGLKCLFGAHKWVTQGAVDATARAYSDYPTIDALLGHCAKRTSGKLILQQCASCRKERAYFCSGSTKQKVDVAWMKEACAKKLSKP